MLENRMTATITRTMDTHRLIAVDAEVFFFFGSIIHSILDFSTSIAYIIAI